MESIYRCSIALEYENRHQRAQIIRIRLYGEEKEPSPVKASAYSALAFLFFGGLSEPLAFRVVSD